MTLRSRLSQESVNIPGLKLNMRILNSQCHNGDCVAENVHTGRNLSEILCTISSIGPLERLHSLPNRFPCLHHWRRPYLDFLEVESIPQACVSALLLILPKFLDRNEAPSLSLHKAPHGSGARSTSRWDVMYSRTIPSCPPQSKSLSIGLLSDGSQRDHRYESTTSRSL